MLAGGVCGVPFGLLLCGPLLAGGVLLLPWGFPVFGEVSVQGLCHCPSHGGFFDQGVPEEVFGGLVCVAVGWPSFVLPQGFRRGPAH